MSGRPEAVCELPNVAFTRENLFDDFVRKHKESQTKEPSRKGGNAAARLRSAYDTSRHLQNGGASHVDSALALSDEMIKDLKRRGKQVIDVFPLVMEQIRQDSLRGIEIPFKVPSSNSNNMLSFGWIIGRLTNGERGLERHKDVSKQGVHEFIWKRIEKELGWDDTAPAPAEPTPVITTMMKCTCTPCVLEGHDMQYRRPRCDVCRIEVAPDNHSAIDWLSRPGVHGAHGCCAKGHSNPNNMCNGLLCPTCKPKYCGGV